MIQQIYGTYQRILSCKKMYLHSFQEGHAKNQNKVNLLFTEKMATPIRVYAVTSEYEFHMFSTKAKFFQLV